MAKPISDQLRWILDQVRVVVLDIIGTTRVSIQDDVFPAIVMDIQIAARMAPGSVLIVNITLLVQTVRDVKKVTMETPSKVPVRSAHALIQTVLLLAVS